MTIGIIGTGSITGLSAGGLPDATVTTADIADANVTAAKLSGAQSGSAPVYGCRAWCAFDGTLGGTNAPAGGGNVTTVQRTAIGAYTITFSTPMQDTNYSVVGTARASGVGNGIAVGTVSKAVGSVSISVTNGAANAATDVPDVGIAIFR